MILQFILTLSTVMCAFLAIRARDQQRNNQYYIFKPMAMILVLSVAVVTALPILSLYFWLIAGGLVFCLIGDIFLMFPSNRFMEGLISFLIGHLFYVWAFISGSGVGATLGLLLLFIAGGTLIYWILFPSLGKMKVPVSLYTIVILIMAWQAWERWISIVQIHALLAAIGAVLFLISDVLLAMNRFKKKFHHAHAFILSFYYVAQTLIALSVDQ